MRVLHVVKTSTGAAWAWRQTAELVRLGLDVHVALPPGGPMVPRYRDSGVTVHELPVEVPLRHPERIPTVANGLRALVADVHPDVIHVHNVGPALLLRTALGRRHPVPRIFQVPGPLHMEHAIFRRAELASAGPIDSWVASCEYARRLYTQAGIAPDRVGMSYYGTAVDEFVPEAHPRGSVRAELGFGETSVLVGMVAYVYAPKRYLGQRRGLKGHEDLVDALALVRRHRPDVVGVFVGGAWGGADAYERRLREYARARLGSGAVFLGTRSDVTRIYGDLDVAVHPSHSENVGGAVESLLMGVPTVATRVGGLPEVVRPGETGWLAAPKAPEDLAQALLHALADPAHAHRLAARGRELVRELFDVRRTAGEVAAEYDRVVARRAGA